MPIPETLARISNEHLARIPLDDARLAELPVELAQLAEVAERVRSRVTFDQESADFRRVLTELAREE